MHPVNGPGRTTAMKQCCSFVEDAANETLEWFILGSKMSLEKAKQKLDMYYTIRRLVPELFANRDPLGSGLSTLHEVMYALDRLMLELYHLLHVDLFHDLYLVENYFCHREYAMLPKYTPEKYNVHIFRPIVNDSSKFDPWELFKYVIMQWCALVWF